MSCRILAVITVLVVTCAHAAADDSIALSMPVAATNLPPILSPPPSLEQPVSLQQSVDTERPTSAPYPVVMAIQQPASIAAPNTSQRPATIPPPNGYPQSFSMQPPQPMQQPAAELETPDFETDIPFGKEAWCKSPYADSAWRFEVDLIPTTSQVSEQSFGGWDDSSGLALRLNLGYEGDDSFGTRVQFWGFGHDAETQAGEIDLSASTLYLDFYKRFFVQDAEIVLGGGMASAYLNYDLPTHHMDAHVNSGGITMFAEGFYPLWRFKRTDIGTVGRGRIALLSGTWDDDGTPFVNSVDHDQMTIMELGWGIEVRRRFGRMQDKYCYFNIVPEFQRWESSSLPDTVDPGFQGTSFSFGLAW